MLRTEISKGFCVLHLDLPPLNPLTFALLDQLITAIEQAQHDPQVRGVILTGGPEHFSAGADIHLFDEIKSAEDAVRMSRVFQAAFQKVEDCTKPVAVAMAGTVIGGALELAMACHVRLAARQARFRMPEVNLGICPGAGGTQRLPRLVGVEMALRMLLTAATIDATKALAVGLVDVVCEGDELVDRARELLLSEPQPTPTIRRLGKLADLREREAALQAGAKLAGSAHPEVAAPRMILDAVRTGLTEPPPVGFRAEQQAFAACMETLTAKNRVYLFFATRQTGKLPELAEVTAAPVRRAAVVGMGTMGTGIALALIQSGIPVIALDEDDAALERGRARIQSSVERRVAQGRSSSFQAAATLGLLSTTTRWDDLAAADLVIESVFEEVGLKRAVLCRVEAICSADALLATNTSTLSLDDLAEDLRRPDRLVGLHFFNPAQRMPLVEVIRRDGTPLNLLATAIALVRQMRKTPVLVSNRAGFLVNRIFVPYLQEAFSLLEEGATAKEIDAAAVAFGFPMGPLVLIDMAGLDILVHAQLILQQSFPRHGSLSAIAARLVQLGHLGQKSGAGVYRYEPGSVLPDDSPDTNRVIAAVQRESGRLDHKIQASEITQRLVLRMVNEAFYVWGEGVARCQSDIDVAMVLGTGFPDFRGGVLKYAEDIGLAEISGQLERFETQCGERFTPCPHLRKKKGNS